MTHHQQHGGQTTQTNLYRTAVGLPEETRVEAVQALNQVLADTTDLQSQAKFAHWNVKGYDFYQLHLLFDELAETLSEHVDLLAERITALGGQAMGTTRIAASTSHIPEPPENAVSESEYLEWLTDHVARHANSLRADIDYAAELGDEDTADLFTELSRDVDEQLYFLESHFQTEVQRQVPAIGGQAGSDGSQTSGGQEMGRQQGMGGGHGIDSQQEMGGRQGMRGGHGMDGQQGISGGQRMDSRQEMGGGQGVGAGQGVGGQQPAGVDGGTHFQQRGTRRGDGGRDRANR